MGRATNTERTASRILQLRQVSQRRGAQVEADLRPVIEDLRSELDATVPKASAARILGVSTTTLDKWVARGLIDAVPVAGTKRMEIPRDAFLGLAEEVWEIRRLGKNKRVLAEALRRLSAQDPDAEAAMERDFGRSLEAARQGNLVKFTLPDDWDPED